MDTPPPTVPTSLRRSRVLPSLAAAVFVTIFVAAGFWQLGRMNVKLALRAQLDAALLQKPGPLPEGAVDWATLRYRPVLLTGHFDASRQFLLDNQFSGGRVGYHVITPLLVTDGRAVLVDRGFVATGTSRTDLPLSPPPAGPVMVQGRINLPPARYVELSPAGNTGAVWQNLDPARFAAQAGLAVLPIVVEQTAPIDGSDRLERAWSKPDLGVDRHRIYSVQWFAFAVLTAGLWLYFMLKRRG